MRIHCFGNSHLWTLLGGEGTSDQRLSHSEDDLEFVGWKLGDSGATAYGLLKKGSRTGAGEKIDSLLASEPGQKDLLMVFGEVDVSDHIGHHVDEDTDLEAAVSRYVTYLRTLEERPDTGLILVASAIPHHSRFRGDDHDRIARIVSKWNDLLQEKLSGTGMVYVDWFTPLDSAGGSPLDGDVDDQYVKNPHDEGERHLNVSARPILVAAVRAALLRFDS